MFQCVWAVCLLEFWKRREARLGKAWGTLGLSETIPDRAGFRGEERNSMIDGRPETFYPAGKRHRHTLVSFTIVAFLVVCVIGAASAVIAARIEFSKMLPKMVFGMDAATVASILASVLNTVQIEVMNLGFVTVAHKLNESWAARQVLRRAPRRLPGTRTTRRRWTT
jgi:hypothetical protein